jgi:DNA-binding transcriptional MerR regulator
MQKLYYSIGQISKLIGEEQHVLRYWEKELGFFRPKKNRAGNRLYSNRDLNIIKTIKILIREEGMSLKEAKHFIEQYQNHDFESGELFPVKQKKKKNFPVLQSKLPNNVGNGVNTGIGLNSIEEIKKLKEILSEMLLLLKNI